MILILITHHTVTVISTMKTLRTTKRGFGVTQIFHDDMKPKADDDRLYDHE